MNKRPRKRVYQIEIVGDYWDPVAATFRRHCDDKDPNYTGGYWEKFYSPRPASFRRCIRALELLTSPEFVR